MNNLLLQHILGLNENLLVDVTELNCRVHEDVVAPLYDFYRMASAAGFDVRVASSYRSFARQLLIWNNKARGLKPVFDGKGKVVVMSELTEREKVFAILRWSALPGASRHHWGTDIDVYDAAHMPPGYQLHLNVAETEGDGPFVEFHRWLTRVLKQNHSGFSRPYAIDRGGIAPEPWHLSYAPVANQFAELLSENILYEQLLETEIELKDAILANISEIFSRFVRV